MMVDLLPLALGAAASDILTSYTFPVSALGGAGLSTVVAKLLRKRLETARQILLEELRKEEKSLYDLGEVDELAAITFRYARAAQEGAARLNLRLMAKVIAGQAQAGPLVADEFLVWADVLASLRREEVVLLGTMMLVRKGHRTGQLDTQKGEHLGKLRDKLREHLIPSHYPSVDALSAAELALGRTGLVVAVAGWDGTFYSPSPLLDELQALTDFQDALREEAIDLDRGHDHP